MWVMWCRLIGEQRLILRVFPATDSSGVIEGARLSNANVDRCNSADQGRACGFVRGRIDQHQRTESARLFVGQGSDRFQQ